MIQKPLTDAMIQYLLTSDSAEAIEWRDRMNQTISELSDAVQAIKADMNRKHRTIEPIQEHGSDG